MWLLRNDRCLFIMPDTAYRILGVANAVSCAVGLLNKPPGFFGCSILTSTSLEIFFCSYLVVYTVQLNQTPYDSSSSCSRSVTVALKLIVVSNNIIS